MKSLDWTGIVRTIASVVVVLQVLGAAATFRPIRGRRFGASSFFIVAFLMVLAGSRRSELLVPALVPGALGLVAAVAMFVWARISIRDRFFSYISSTDVPQFVCSDGPYGWIRHPFYASYLLSLLATTLMFPNSVTVVGIVFAALTLNSAAAFEEDKFKQSPVAAEYAAYVERTGRFVPRFTGRHAGIS